MLKEPELRKLARAALRAGKLPRGERIAPGEAPGSGHRGGCARGRHHQAVEYEFSSASDGANPGLDKYHVHLRCFAVWSSSEPSSLTRARRARLPKTT